MTRSGNISEVDGMIKKSANKPGGTKFKQQKLPAWQPVLSATTVLPVLLAVGLSFIPLGIAFIVSTNAVKEKVIYYAYCDGGPCNTCIGTTPDVSSNNSFTLDESFPGPVYMYYGLTSFYQNHRRYVKSRDDAQLAGSDSSSLSSDCDPFIRNATGFNYAPCGAAARSLFSDVFELRYVGNKSSPFNVSVSRTGIAWSTDLKTKFKNPPGFNSTCIGTGCPIGPVFERSVKPENWKKPVWEMEGGYQNEPLIVWMRTAAFPTFRKLYGKIAGGLFANGLPKGTYELCVNGNFTVSKFGGHKKMILSTTSFLGGKNSFLGIAYLVVGSLSLLVGFVFLVIHIRVGKRTQSSKANLNKNTPYFDTTMSDLMQSKMNVCY